jgi:hypothetical protein
MLSQAASAQARQSGRRRDDHALRAAPEPLEVVEEPRVAREDVHDEVEVVDEDPGSVGRFGLDVGRLSMIAEPRRSSAMARLARVGARTDESDP